MKLFFYDSKHSNVNGELDLGDLTPGEEEKIEKIIEWLGKLNVLDGRYRNLILAKEFKMNHDPEGGHSEIDFTW